MFAIKLFGNKKEPRKFKLDKNIRILDEDDLRIVNYFFETSDNSRNLINSLEENIQSEEQNLINFLCEKHNVKGVDIDRNYLPMIKIRK